MQNLKRLGKNMKKYEKYAKIRKNMKKYDKILKKYEKYKKYEKIYFYLNIRTPKS